MVRGVTFRGINDDDQYRLVIDSHRRWYLVLGMDRLLATGLVVSLDLDNGGVNTVELIARGDTGYLAVNGSFVTVLDLSDLTDPGDIWISAGSFPENIRRSGDIVPYADFEIWELPLR